MGRDVLPLTVDRLGDLTGTCADCVFWEARPGPRRAAPQAPAPGQGELAHRHAPRVGDTGAGGLRRRPVRRYITYAPPHLVPRALAFPTAPVSRDATVLVTARIDPEYAGQGLGRVLVQSAAKDVLRRGGKALEAYGSGSGQAPCLLPAEFLTAVGPDCSL